MEKNGKNYQKNGRITYHEIPNKSQNNMVEGEIIGLLSTEKEMESITE